MYISTEQKKQTSFLTYCPDIAVLLCSNRIHPLIVNHTESKTKERKVLTSILSSWLNATLDLI